jgi:hypothetical protein
MERKNESRNCPLDERIRMTTRTRNSSVKFADEILLLSTLSVQTTALDVGRMNAIRYRHVSIDCGHLFQKHSNAVYCPRGFPNHLYTSIYLNGNWNEIT